MFLIVGYEGDRTTRHVCAAARAVAADHHFLNLGAAVETESVHVEWSAPHLAVTVGDERFDLSEYTGFYSRLYFQATGSPMRDAALSELVSWTSAHLDQSDALVINRPGSGWSNYTKLQHTKELADVGFRVPRSVITASPEVASELVASGRWVSKPCSGTRSETVLVDLALCERLKVLEHAPTQFQEYIEGVDVRLHWLRGECFPLQIQAASGVDYRFGEGENEFSEIEVPDEVARLCAAFCEEAGLELAGFDFKLDAAGEWVALEANPMPGFDYYDRRLDGVIGRRLIEMLGAGPGRREPFIERRRRPPLSSPLPAE